jgi:hypothetical protein
MKSIQEENPRDGFLFPALLTSSAPIIQVASIPSSRFDDLF